MSLKTINWDKYVEILEGFSDENLRQEFTIVKNTIGFDRWGEDNLTSFKEFTLYGVFDTPYHTDKEVDTYETAGRINPDALSILVSKKEVKRVGLLTTDGGLDISPGDDTIKIRGKVYQIISHNPMALALDAPIFFQIGVKLSFPITSQETLLIK